MVHRCRSQRRRALIVIDEALAKQYWPNEDPVGTQILRGRNNPPATIIGIVGHAKQTDLVGDSGKGTRFLPIYQQGTPMVAYLVKTNGNPASLTGAIRRAVMDVDPTRPIYDAKTMEERVNLTLGSRRFALTMIGVFAAIALGMAALGLYGVISYSVGQRRQEIRVRMALGAQQSQAASLVLMQGFRLAATGVFVGLVASYALARALETQLYETQAFDPATFLGMASLLVAVAMVASYVPARRAMKVDPLEALRYE